MENCVYYIHKLLRKDFVMSKKLNDPFIWYAVADWVEENVPYVLGILARRGFSLNEQWPDDTIDKSQKTGGITVRLAEVFEEATYEVLKAAGLSVKRKADSGGDITINGKPWEIKTTQGPDIQGATHSSQKPPRYIMIKYKLDYDKNLSVENNEGLIIELGVWISEDIDSDWWHGKPTKTNSRTTLKIPIEGGSVIDTIIGDFNDSSSHGRMYCKLINEDVQWK